MAESSSEVIRFDMVSKQDEAASRAAGRPVFRELEYIEIRNPGDRLSINHRQIEDEDKRKYANQYAHWLKTREDPTSGTPLREWAPVTRSQVEHLAYSGVKTVEELAGVTDGNAQQLGAGYISLIQKARDQLAATKGQDVAAVLRAEMEMLRASNMALMAQVSDLANRAQAKADGKEMPAPVPVHVFVPPAQVSAVSAAPATPAAPKKRGRPAKKTEVVHGG